MQINLTVPDGPIASKYERFVLDGEPEGSIPGVPYYGAHQVMYMAGDTGTSKTTALIDWLIWSAYLYPGCNLGLYRASLQDLKRSTWDKMQWRLSETSSKKFYELNKVDWTVKFPEWGGSTIYMFGLDTGDPIQKLKSFEAFRAGVDEANEIDEQVADLLLLRIRQKAKHRHLKDAKNNPIYGFNQLKMVSNRDGGEDHWLYQTYRQGGKEVLKDHYRKTFAWQDTEGSYSASSLMIESFYWENHSLTQNVRLTGAMMSDEGRKRYMGGVWSKKDGLVFPEFGTPNIIPQAGIPEDWPVYVGIDHGISHPTVAIFIAVDYDGNWFVFDEYYVKGATATDNARTIMAKWGQRRNPVQWFGDPSMWQVEASGMSAADYYLETGLPLGPSIRTASLRDPQNRDNDFAINEMSERIKAKGQLGGQIRPTMFWMENCTKSIKEFRSVTWENLAKFENDDCMKATRYAAAMIPRNYIPNIDIRIPVMGVND